MNLRPMRVALVGKKNAGKDTVADQLCATHGFTRIAFADLMKEMLHVGLGIPREVLYGPAAIKEEIDPRFGVSIRYMLQTIGTEWGRNLIHERIWITRMLDEILPAREGAEGILRWVVSDVRQLNEAAALKAAGFTLVRIVRPDSSTGKHENHASETEQDQIVADVELQNDADLEALFAQVEFFVAWHLWPSETP